MRRKTKQALLAMAIGVLAAGFANSAENRTAATPRAAEATEAQRRAALAEHDQKKAEFARRCAPGIQNPSELRTCQTLYRELYRPANEGERR